MRPYGLLRLLGPSIVFVLLNGCSLVEEVLDRSPYGIAIEPGLVVLEVGDAVQLLGVAYAGEGLTAEPLRAAWASSDTSIAAVDSNGLVTGVSAGGPIEITASVAEASTTATVVVVKSSAASCPDLGLAASEPRVEGPGTWQGVSSQVHLFDIPEPPPLAVAYEAGPGTVANRRPPRRSMFPLPCPGRLAVAWQAGASGQIYLTQIDDDLGSHVTLPLMQTDHALVAAAFGYSMVYLVTMEMVVTFEERPVELQLHAVGVGSFQGVERSVTLETRRSGLNVVAEGPQAYVGHASLTFSEGRLALLLARTMHQADDGLNHQGGIAAIFDARTLALTRYLGQTSGHSFQNQLVAARAGGFLGVDMADNYPRGVHLHRFDEFEWRRQVVFTFKTLHGTTQNNPAGKLFAPYEDISTPERTFYRWSNDNNTYSELGVVLETDDGLVVAFVGEPDAAGLSLRNEAAVTPIFHARNVGIVTVDRAFAGVDWPHPPNVVPDAIVLTPGPPEEGGFYTFGGVWAPQRNTGVRWLTRGRDLESENATRLKGAQLATDRILLVWERWSRTTYLDTRFMVVDHLGTVIVPETSMGAQAAGARLHRSNDVAVVGDRMISFAGVPGENRLSLLVLQLVDAAP
jgi:hypothetical protein